MKSRGRVLAALAALVITASGASVASAGELTPALASELALRAPGEMVPVYIVMQQAPDYAAMDREAAHMNKEARRAFVSSQLRAEAALAQDGILGELNRLVAEGEARDVRSLRIAGAVAAEVTPEAARQIALRSDVVTVAYDGKVYMLDSMAPAMALETPHSGTTPVQPTSNPPPASPLAVVWSVTRVGAPTVWTSGYNGAGSLVAVLDTGVWYTHSDLTNRMHKNLGDPWPADFIDNDGNGYVDDYYGYDFAYNDRDPVDGHGHGTHCSGSVLGDGTAGTQTGMAPGAQCMALKVLDNGGYGNPSDVVEAIQYAIDNSVDVMSLSIGWWQPDVATRQTYRTACEGARVAGVVMCVAAGNERGSGTPPNELRSPGDVPPPWIHPDVASTGTVSGVITVGATGYMTDTYAYFSSRGPTTWASISPWFDWASPYLNKPDVMAPGQNVNSTVMGGGYSGDSWSGTSMATPHVAGMVALMLSKNPDMLPAQVDMLMELNCLPLGTAGKDNDYGSGRIRAVEIMAAVPPPGPDLTSPGQTLNLSTAPMPGFGKVRLNWTAPGDDGIVGTADAYDIRYRLAAFGPIDTDAEFDTAPQAAGEPEPQTAGSAETMVVGQLQQGKNYYFALKTYDEVPNPSLLSNSPIGTASGSATPAGSVGEIDRVGGEGPLVHADGHVTLRDIEGNPVGGATVDVQWSGLVSGRVSATTDAQGTARFSSPTASASARGMFQFTVVAATASGRTIDLGPGITAEMAYGMQMPRLGGLSLAQATPNPLGSRGSAIQFNLPAQGQVSLRVYDVTGSLVSVLADGDYAAGAHQIRWDGRDADGHSVPNGVYYYRLETAGQTLSRKMTVLR